MYLWAQDIRDDGDMGDAKCHSWPDAGYDGLRAHLAGDRQDRPFQIAGDRFYTEDASRAGIRLGGGSIGGGKRVLPRNVSVKLDLLDERRFANGMVYLRYFSEKSAVFPLLS